jgi:hypothetical protein
MRRGTAILTAALSLALAGCVLTGKPKTAPTPVAPRPAPASTTPQQPLSIPQTQAQLPAPQPLNPEALATAPAPEQPAPAPPPNPRPVRRPAPSTQARPETQPPAQATQPPEPERPPVLAIVPAAEQKQLQDSAQTSKREANQVLAQMRGRTLTPAQRDYVQRIRSFVNQSDQAEQRGDMRQASALAERARALARELQSGK